MLTTRASLALPVLLIAALLALPGCTVHVATPATQPTAAVTPEEGRTIAQWLRTEWHRMVEFHGIRAVYADGDTVYVETTYNYLAALATKTGMPKWVLKTRLPLDFAPVSWEDRLYFFAGEYLYVVNRDSGEVIASKNPHLGVLVPPVASKTTVFVGSADGKVHAVDVADIWPKWTFPLEALPIGLAFMPPNKVLAVTDESELLCVDIDSGQRIWQIPVGDKCPVAGPTVSGNVIYLSGRDLFLHAYDEGGNQLWRCAVSGVATTPPVVLGDTVVVTLVPAAAAVVNATNGELMWRQSGPAHFLTASKERLYFLDAEKKRVLCYDRATGKPQGAVGTASFASFCGEPTSGRFTAATRSDEAFGYVDVSQTDLH